MSVSADALYVHGGSAGALRWLRGTFRGKSVVANPHGMEEFEHGGILRWTNRVFTRHLARGAELADVVLATDESMVPIVLSRLSVPRSKVVVVPNGVDVDALRRAADLGAGSAEAVDIVTVGRLVWNKGYDLLLDALAILLEEPDRESVSWRHFGSGEFGDHLKSHADQVQGLSFELVEGAPDVEVQAGVRAARLFVQPSRYEGSSLTTLEAMAQGTICVGTPVGGIPDKLHDGITGFLARDVSAASIADAIRRAEAASGNVGERALAEVQGRFSLNTSMDVLGRLLGSASRQPRRILQVARHIQQGSGVAQVAFALERAFRGLGVETERLTLANVGLRMHTSISRNPLMKIALGFEVIWFSIFGTVCVQRRMRIDPTTKIIVHGDPIGGDIYVNHGLLKAVMERRRSGRRVYVPANPMHWATLLRDEYRYSHRMQRSIVNLNSRDDETMHRLYPSLTTPTRVIPNGVDVEHYRHVDERFRQITRNEQGFLASDVVLLFIGNEFVRKGLFLVLDAMKVLPEEFKLMVVGGTSEMIDNAMGYSKDCGVNRRVLFVGKQEDPRPYYAGCDVFVLPSAYEAAQLSLLEALASGRPCVVTRVGNAPDVVHSGVNGELVSRDVKALCEGLQEVVLMLRDDGASLKKACQMSVVELSWECIARRYLALLSELGGRE